MGRRESVKLADENNASVERGGRPCLLNESCQQIVERNRHCDILH